MRYTALIYGHVIKHRNLAFNKPWVNIGSFNSESGLSIYTSITDEAKKRKIGKITSKAGLI